MTVDVEIWKWTALGMRKEGIGEFVTKRDAEYLLEQADERRRVQSAKVIQKLRQQLIDEGYEPCA